jgi:cytidylate kinase
MKTKNVVITIDGPVASGKSTIAQALAKHLGFYYLYTGLLYRAVAYIQDQFKDLHGLNVIKDITYEYRGSKPHILYKSNDITHFLYDASLDQKSSIVSADPDVRAALLPIQHAVASKYNILADGRDCGTVVFPDATVKIFLTADLETRSWRLFNDNKRTYAGMTFEEVHAALVERDNRDQSRPVAPLRIPDNALIIDNSRMTREQTIETFLKLIHDKIKPG